MKVIDIRGKNNCGKSLIIKFIREYIANSGEVEKIKKEYIKEYDDDFKETFVVYKFKGKVIAIVSQGDNESFVKRVTKLIKQLSDDGIKLDYLFHTSRTKGGSVKESDKIKDLADELFVFWANRIQEEILENEVEVQKKLFVNFIMKVIKFKEDFDLK